MIINFNITGKESAEELERQVREALNTLQEDIPTHSGPAAISTGSAYYALGVSLVSQQMVNTAANILVKAKGYTSHKEIDAKLLRELISSELMPDLVEGVSKIVNSMVSQIERNEVTVKEIRK